MAKHPPITGLPPMAERPRCAWCDKPLAFWTDTQRGKRPGGSTTPEVLSRAFESWKGYPRRVDPPLFHSLGCAMHFAHAAFTAGYRRTR